MLKEQIKDKIINRLIIRVDLCSSVDKYKMNLSDYLVNISYQLLPDSLSELFRAECADAV